MQLVLELILTGEVRVNGGKERPHVCLQRQEERMGNTSTSGEINYRPQPEREKAGSNVFVLICLSRAGPGQCGAQFSKAQWPVYADSLTKLNSFFLCLLLKEFLKPISTHWL